MPPRTFPEDERFLSAYREAALIIARQITQATPERRAQALRTINSIISELDGLSARYVAETLPMHFRDGSDEAIRELRRLSKKKVDTTFFSSLYTEVLQAVTDDAALRFANTLEGVRRESVAALNRMEKQKIMEELVRAEITGTRPNVQGTFEDLGITAFRSGNRTLTLENYSAMLTDTVLSEAHNTGAMARYVSNGVQFAEVIERADAKDAACSFMNGKIVWLGDRRLLPPFHPNCRGGIKPFLGQPENPIMTAEDAIIPDQVRTMLIKS